MNVYLAPPDFAAYYSYPRSVFKDLDLDLLNEYEHFEFQRHMLYLTSEGYVSNDWPMGTGVLWSPFFLMGEAAARVTGADADGYSSPYLVMTAAGILFFVGCGLLAAFSFIEKIYDSKLAFITVLLGFIGTPLLFYTFYGGMMSHATGFFVVTLFFITWASTLKERRIVHWILLGLLAGLMTSVRPQHLASLVVFPVEIIFKMKDGAFKGNSRYKKDYLRGVLFSGAAFIIAMGPQLMFWSRIYGSPFHLPKLEEMHWFRPALWETLFSDYHGLLLWTPLVLPGSFGLLFLGKKRPVLAWGLGACLVIQLYINSANEVWWAGGSFSNRRFTEYGFIFMIGLAALLRERRFRIWIIPAVLFALWPLLLVMAERSGKLTLAHYVPWNNQFFGMLPSVISFDTLKSMTGNFGGTGILGRILAVLFTGSLLFLAWLFFVKRNDYARHKQRFVMVFVILSMIMNVIVMHASFRTDPVPEEWRDNIYRENRFLWENYYEYGFYLLVKGRLDDAKSAYLKARELLPHRPQPARYIGAIYEEQENFEAAEKFYREALTLAPDYESAKRALEMLQMEKAMRGL